jgi:hypothetical protein
VSQKKLKVNPVGSGLAWAEEAASWLRAAKLDDWLTYYVGAVPFALALLWFFSEMAYSGVAQERLSRWMVMLPVLYVWLKCWQCVFCQRLIRRHSLEENPPWTWKRLLRMILQQGIIQSMGLWATTICAQVILPYILVYSFFASALILADGTRPGIRSVLSAAWEQCRLWQSAAHKATVVILLVGGMLFLNLFILSAFLPTLAQELFGWAPLGARSIGEVVNTTTVSIVAALAYLGFDPYRKALYAVRTFHANARRSGEDLRVDLKRAIREKPGQPAGRPPAKSGALAALVAMGLFLGSGGTGLSAAEGETGQGDGKKPAQVEAFDASLDDVLAQKEFSWRIPRQMKVERQENEALNSYMDGLTRTVRDFVRWIGRALSGTPPVNMNGAMPEIDSEGLGKAVLYLVIALGVGLIGYVLWRFIRQMPRSIESDVAVIAAPDIRSETVTADQLPEDGWLTIAREMAAAGEFRFALRALYLASLAHLGGRTLLILAKHKSNYDYASELQRRARGNTQLLDVFAITLRAFERSWYGEHPVQEEGFAAASETFERLKTC